MRLMIEALHQAKGDPQDTEVLKASTTSSGPDGNVSDAWPCWLGWQRKVVLLEDMFWLRRR